MDFVENYLLDSNGDIDIVEVLQHERRPYIVRERADNFEKWNDHDFHARFSMQKDTVLSILELIEDSLEFRSDRNTNFYTTQFLSGCGSSRKFSLKINKFADDLCMYCQQVDDVARRWHRERTSFETDSSTDLEPDNINLFMVTSQIIWNRATTYIRKIMESKATEELEYQSSQRQKAANL
ncbi:hypothetical protein JTB14_026326 [Gonioctena quinquepunctata]|nr:hypothetical protein JTB14_026326 [Gonioctena quinquepunctata]